jgi:hypothetical protein
MSGGELWFVKLPNGDVHHVTVDQLDMAFEAGHIDADTLVLADGSSQWTRLGEAAGLDEEPPPRAAPAPYAPASYPSRAPVARPATVMSPTPAPVVRTVTAISPGPRGATPYTAPGVPAGSIRPVAFDLGSDLEMGEVAFKRSASRTGWVVAALAVAVMGGGVGFAATHGVALGSSLGAAGADVGAAAAVPVSVPVATAPPPPAPAPDPAPPAAAPAPLGGALPAMESGLNPRFTDAQRDKLLAADKARAGHAKARGGGHYAASPRYKASLSFTKGGNKYDPLNSDL